MRALIGFVLPGIVSVFLPVAQAQVQLGSEVLAANGFKELHGKRVGSSRIRPALIATGNRPIDLLRRAPG